MPRSFFVCKKTVTARSFRFLAPTLPVAALFAFLSGCGSGGGTAPAPDVLPSGVVPSAFPTAFPSGFPFPTPTPSATPTPTPSATAPAQIVTGTLRIEDVTNAGLNNPVVAVPFTPTTGSANFPDVSSFPVPFTFTTNATLTTGVGAPITSRRLVLNLVLPSTKVGVPVTFGTNLATLEYRENVNEGTPTSSANIYRNPSRNTVTSGTVTLVSVVNDVYTFDFDAYLTPRGEPVTDTGSFRLRGTVTIYAPNNSRPVDNR